MIFVPAIKTPNAPQEVQGDASLNPTQQVVQKDGPFVFDFSFGDPFQEADAKILENARRIAGEPKQ